MKLFVGVGCDDALMRTAAIIRRSTEETGVIDPVGGSVLVPAFFADVSTFVEAIAPENSLQIIARLFVLLVPHVAVTVLELPSVTPLQTFVPRFVLLETSCVHVVTPPPETEEASSVVTLAAEQIKLFPLVGVEVNVTATVVPLVLSTTTSVL